MRTDKTKNRAFGHAMDIVAEDWLLHSYSVSQDNRVNIFGAANAITCLERYNCLAIAIAQVKES